MTLTCMENRSLAQYICQLNTNWSTHCTTVHTQVETRKLCGADWMETDRQQVGSLFNSLTPVGVLKHAAFPPLYPAPFMLSTSPACQHTYAPCYCWSLYCQCNWALSAQVKLQRNVQYTCYAQNTGCSQSHGWLRVRCELWKIMKIISCYKELQAPSHECAHNIPSLPVGLNSMTFQRLIVKSLLQSANKDSIKLNERDTTECQRSAIKRLWSPRRSSRQCHHRKR